MTWVGPSLAVVVPRCFDEGGCWSRERWFWCWRADENGSTYKKPFGHFLSFRFIKQSLTEWIAYVVAVVCVGYEECSSVYNG